MGKTELEAIDGWVPHSFLLLERFMDWKLCYTALNSPETRLKHEAGFAFVHS